ncbi:MAG: hypothetical protein ABJ327_12570 [Litoreibacter sp.]
MSRTTTTQYDSENEFEWDSIATTFIDGVMSYTDTTFDNGLGQVVFYYADGNIRTVRDEDSEDDVFPWSSFATGFDEDGNVESTFEIRDNGTSIQENFHDDGYLISRRFDYPSNENPNALDTLSTIFNADGSVERVFGTYENGTQYQDEYDDGVRVTRYQLDNPRDSGDGVKSWDYITINYDTQGQVTDKTTYYDNGVSTAELFENGVRISIIRNDRDDASSWSQIASYYDGSGAIDHVETSYDDGTEKLEFFDNGIRTSIRQSDNVDPFTGNAPLDGGAKTWNSIDTLYDASGTIEYRETRNDDGTVKIEGFDDGVRTTLDQYDNIEPGTEDAPADGGVKTWATISTRYDASGTIEFRETRNDDGTVKIEDFDDGVRSQLLQYDNVEPGAEGDGPADGGAKSWAAIATIYDASGTIEFRTRLNDNGTGQLEYFEDGVRTETHIADLADVFEWNEIRTLYENDEKSSKTIQWDSADELVLIYDNQEQVTRLELDGDHSETWDAQLTEYGADGPVVTTYDSYRDIPDEYDALFIDPNVLATSFG